MVSHNLGESKDLKWKVHAHLINFGFELIFKDYSSWKKAIVHINPFSIYENYYPAITCLDNHKLKTKKLE